MKTIDPKPGRIKKLMQTVAMDKPIVMLNMLKFREQANYPEGSGHSPCSGAEAYQRYSDNAIPTIKAAAGDVLWQGRAMGTVIAPEDEDWDQVLLVQWPSFQTFINVVLDPEYQKGTVHRTSALEDARLVMLEQ